MLLGHVEKNLWILLAVVKWGEPPFIARTATSHCAKIVNDVQEFPVNDEGLKSGRPQFPFNSKGCLFSDCKGPFYFFPFVARSPKLSWKCFCQGALQAKRAWETKRGTSVAKNTSLQGGTVASWINNAEFFDDYLFQLSFWGWPKKEIAFFYLFPLLFFGGGGIPLSLIFWEVDAFLLALF